MEDTLRDLRVHSKLIYSLVLILVLMEDTLRAAAKSKRIIFWDGLNPCFNGRYSQSNADGERILDAAGVLILVLMEDTLRDLIGFLVKI